ncbi:MAG TPA: hypothetical protein VM055_00770 [Novosphingobium sp.]|nr:hypothetical protein [Novosphingobium sp.]
MLIPLFVPMAAFAAIVAVVASITGLIATGMVHKSIREAMKTHPESVPSLIAALNARAPWVDALIGWVAFALGATIVVFALFESDEYTRTQMLQASVIPFVVGIVVLVYLRVARPQVPAITSP